jgi:hypothetical protein
VTFIGSQFQILRAIELARQPVEKRRTTNRGCPFLPAVPLPKSVKRKMPPAFGECPLSGKADATADITFR